MMLLNVFLALLVAAVFFLLGAWLSDRWHTESDIRVKEALERQYLRLQAGMDADDPCKPYVATQQRRSAKTNLHNELLAELTHKVNKDGQATVLIKPPHG